MRRLLAQRIVAAVRKGRDREQSIDPILHGEAETMCDDNERLPLHSTVLSRKVVVGYLKPAMASPRDRTRPHPTRRII